MNKEFIQKIKEDERALAEQRAIDRMNGVLSLPEKPGIFRQLIDEGSFINPREEYLKVSRERRKDGA